MNEVLLLTNLPAGVPLRIPYVLLLICPVLILTGAALPPRWGRPFLVAALLLLGLGTGGLFLAAGGGSHAAPLRVYRSFLTETRLLFCGLTAIYLAVICMPNLLHRRASRLFSTALPLSFLVLYSAGAMFLLQTAGGAAAAGQATQGIQAGAPGPGNELR